VPVYRGTVGEIVVGCGRCEAAAAIGAGFNGVSLEGELPAPSGR